MNTVKLEKLGACEDALEWAAGQKSQQAAWDNCTRGDWMLWLLGKLSGKPGSRKRKRLGLACCECARLALRHVPDGEDRPRIAIETAEAWASGSASASAKGSVTLDQVRTAAYADAAAAYAAAATADAADAAAATADAADAAAAAADAADAAADAAATAATTATAAATRKKTLKECAEIVRRHYPRAPKL